MDGIIFGMLVGLYAAVIVGFYEIDKAIKRKDTSGISADLVEIKLVLEEISAEISAARTGIRFLNDKIES